MSTTSIVTIRTRTFFLACTLALSIHVVGANAAVLVSLLINPTTTAGAGSNSNRSGNGTWQLYAVDNANDNFGISSYDVTIRNTGGTLSATTRSPQTNYDADGGGTPAPSGFTFLRQTLGNNTSTVELTAAQAPPPNANSSANVGDDYYPISGFGQTASSFAAKYPNPILGPTTGSLWGNYNSFFLNPINMAFVPYYPTNGNHWVFLGEGAFTGGFVPMIIAATSTVYSNFTTTFLSTAPATLIVTPQDDPEPATMALICIAGGMVAFYRRPSATRILGRHRSNR